MKGSRWCVRHIKAQRAGRRKAKKEYAMLPELYHTLHDDIQACIETEKNKALHELGDQRVQLGVAQHNYRQSLKLYSDLYAAEKYDAAMAAFKLVDENGKAVSRIADSILNTQKQLANNLPDMQQLQQQLTIALHKFIDPLPGGREAVKEIMSYFQNSLLREDRGTDITPDQVVLEMDDTVPQIEHKEFIDAPSLGPSDRTNGVSMPAMRQI